MKQDTMSAKGHVLLAERNDARRDHMAGIITGEGHSVSLAWDRASAVELLQKHVFSVIIAHLRSDDSSEFALLDYARDNMPHTPVIVLTDSINLELAVDAMRRGAFDLLENPVSDERLLFSLGNAIEKAALHNAYDYLRHEQPFIYKLSGIVAHSPRMLTVMEQVEKVARTDATVLLTGETGTGKSLIAGAIHFNSNRRSGNLITVNCAALAESLLEDELFGHEKGAFTGAHKARTGRFQQAHGGTLFLDEVGDMSPALQAKVLRAIEEKVVERVGGNRSLEVDVRIMAATNVDLRTAVEKGKFREDLYYRLKVATIRMPSLKRRREDIIPLAERFLRQLAAESKRAPRDLSLEAEAALLKHDWPGNIRELRNVIERAIIFSSGEDITPGDLALERGEPQQNQDELPGTLNLAELEERAIITALERCDFVQRKAAKLLGITPRGLHYKLGKLDISHPKLAARRRSSN